MLIEGLNRKDTIIIIILYLPNFHPWPGARPGRGRGGVRSPGSRLVQRVFQQSLSLTLTSWAGDVINGASLSQVDWDNISQHLPLQSFRRQVRLVASCCLGEIAFQHLTFNFAKSKNTEIMGEEVMVIWVQSHAAHRQHDE